MLILVVVIMLGLLLVTPCLLVRARRIPAVDRFCEALSCWLAFAWPPEEPRISTRPVPAPAAVRHALPVKTFVPDQEAGEDACCPICFCEYVQGEKLSTLPCDHFYHSTCINKWLKRDASCPLCKYSLHSPRRQQQEQQQQRRPPEGVSTMPTAAADLDLSSDAHDTAVADPASIPTGPCDSSLPSSSSSTCTTSSSSSNKDSSNRSSTGSGGGNSSSSSSREHAKQSLYAATGSSSEEPGNTTSTGSSSSSQQHVKQSLHVMAGSSEQVPGNATTGTDSISSICSKVQGGTSISRGRSQHLW